MSKLKYCMYRAAYTETVLKKSSWYHDATYLNEKSQIIPMFYPIKESVCQNLWQGHKAWLPGLGDFEFNAPKEVLNEMNFDRSDAELINPKGETQKTNIMINAEIFMGTLFIETREAIEGTWLYFKDPLKQEQTLLYQGDTFEIDSVRYLFDQDKKPKILTIIKFSDSVTAKTVRAGNKKYLTSKLDRKRNLVVQLKNKTKYIDNFLLFETNHRNLFYTTEKLTTTEQNFSTTDISETDLRDIKLDQYFVWDFRGMFENLKQIELLNCHIEKLHRAMILTTSINGNSHPIFLSQQNALGTHTERAGGIL